MTDTRDTSLFRLEGWHYNDCDTVDHNMAERHRTVPAQQRRGSNQGKLEIAQSEQDVSPFCKESDMTYRPSWKRQIGLFLRQ